MMFARLLFEDDLFRLKGGVLGGLAVEHKQYGSVLKVPSPMAQFFHSVVSQYSKLGGQVAPNDLGFAAICEEFVWSIYPNVNSLKAQVYFKDDPQAIAQRAKEARSN